MNKTLGNSTGISEIPSARIALVTESLRCFAYGWLSLIPLLGLGFAALAIRLHFKIWAGADADWNPAQRYLAGGLYLAWIGGFISVGALMLFVVLLMRTYGM